MLFPVVVVVEVLGSVDAVTIGGAAVVTVEGGVVTIGVVCDG